jgi:hypothetical protein
VLPRPAPELFLEAGFIVAGRAARATAGPALEKIVRRAVQHAVALRDPRKPTDSRATGVPKSPPPSVNDL